MEIENATASSNLTTELRNQCLQTTDYHIILWGIVDTILILTTLAGNILTICAVKLSRKLSAVLSNQFIFSLAISDIMVGLSIPYHYAFYIHGSLNYNKNLCLLRFVLLVFACSSSMSNLLGTATDRYIAIVYPLHYSRYMTKKVAIILIFSGWILSLAMATVPIYWNNWSNSSTCELIQVLPVPYVSFMMTPMFASIWVTMLLLYIRIWKEAAGHAKRLRSVTTYQHGPGPSDSKSIQVVLLILGCFSICWLPFFIMVMYMQAFGSFESSLVYEVAFSLAMANSCMNPLIYAWKNSNFRKIFWCLLRCKLPNGVNYGHSFITNHVPTTKTIQDATKGICNGKEECIVQTEIDIEMDSKVEKSINKLDSEMECSVDTISTSVNSLSRT